MYQKVLATLHTFRITSPVQLVRKLPTDAEIAQEKPTRYLFVKRPVGDKGVCEVALCGSMVTEDPYPNDVDLAIVVESLDDLPKLARCARQIISTYHGWEVFRCERCRTPE